MDLFQEHVEDDHEWETAGGYEDADAELLISLDESQQGTHAPQDMAPHSDCLPAYVVPWYCRLMQLCPGTSSLTTMPSTADRTGGSSIGAHARCWSIWQAQLYSV